MTVPIAPPARARGWPSLPRVGRRHLAYLGLLLVLVLVPTASFLFGSGVVIFQNWDWAVSSRQVYPSPSVINALLWTNSGPDASGYTRALTSWPPFLLLAITHDPFILERAFFIFVYAANFVLAFGAGTLLLRLLEGRVDPARREWVRAFFIVIMFVNPAALQWEAGVLVPFLWGTSLISIAILASLLAVRRHSFRYGLMAGLALGLGATLDPRILIWGELGVLLVLAVEVVRVRCAGAVARALIGDAIGALPGALLTYFAYAWTGATTGTPIHSGTYAAIQAASSNASPMKVLELLGYDISGITYASPVGAWFSGPLGQVATRGHPAFLVADNSVITVVWVLALVAIPLAAFGSLLSRRSQPLALPLAPVALVAALLAMGTSGPFTTVPRWESDLGGIHAGGIGLIADTVVGVPAWIQVLTEAAYVPMITLTFVALVGVREGTTAVVDGMPVRIRKMPGPWRLDRELSYRSRRGVAVGLTALLLFGSWQFFSGSFYPGGLSPGVSPNSVPETGSLAPATPPASDVAAFSSLSAHPTEGAVYWPGPDSYSYPWNPRWSPPVAYSTPFVSLPVTGLGPLLAQNATGALAPLLAASGVSSVVVDNMSAPALTLAFGRPDLSGILNAFSAAPGLRSDSLDPSGASVFGLNDSPGIVSFVNRTYVPLFPSSLSGIPIAALAGTGQAVGLVASNGSTNSPALGYANEASTLSPTQGLVVTAANLSTLEPVRMIRGFPGDGSGPLSSILSRTGDHPLPEPYSNWTVAVWALDDGSVNVSSTNGTQLELNRSGSTVVASLNYLSSLVDGSIGGIPVSPSNNVTFHVAAQVQGGNGFSGTVWANVVASNLRAVNLRQFSTAATTPSGNWTNLSLSGVLPAGAALFTMRLFANFTGPLNVSNVTIGWSELTPSPTSFSGSLLPTTNYSATLPAAPVAFPVDLWGQLSGAGVVAITSDGSTAVRDVEPAPLAWVELPGVRVGGSVQINLSGNLTVSGFLILPSESGPASSGSVSNLSLGDDYSVSGAFSSSGPGYLLLHEPYSSEWQLQLDGTGSETGTATVLGGLLFAIPAGVHQFTFSLRGIGSQPLLLGADAVAMLLLMLAAIRPAVFLSPGKRLRDRLRRLRPGSA